MDAVRCPECGDVRWSLFGFKHEPGTCELCGAEMVPERRRPRHAAAAVADERRDVAVEVPAAAAPPVG